MTWRLHHRHETVSTNLDARSGAPGDVFTADFQSAGRGRLDHRWLSPPGVNLMMSVVVSVLECPPEQVATFPLVVGLSVARGIRACLNDSARAATLRLKWPNDVLLEGRKVAGILCERVEDRVVVGIGVNVGAQEFPPEIAARATFVGAYPVAQVRACILDELGAVYEIWRTASLAAFQDELARLDALRGKRISVLQTDDDCMPITGVCGGIRADGSLDVGGVAVYAGEAHILSISEA